MGNTDVANEEILSAKEAIDAAFGHFREFYRDAGLKSILLEGLDYEEENQTWDVAIGFDIGRQKISGSQLTFLEKTQEPIREVRTVSINAKDGSFVRMERN